MKLRHLSALFLSMAMLVSCTAVTHQTITVVNAARRPINVLAVTVTPPARKPADPSGIAMPGLSTTMVPLAAQGSLEFEIATSRQKGIFGPVGFTYQDFTGGMSRVHLEGSGYELPNDFREEAAKWKDLQPGAMRRQSNAGRIEYRSKNNVTLTSAGKTWRLKPD